MLTFTDQKSNIRVFRIVESAEGQPKRERIGSIKKKDMSLDNDLEVLTDPADREEIQAILKFYADAQKAEGALAAFTLPKKIREAVEYCQQHGTDFEKRAVAAACFEGVRALRRIE